MRSRDPIAEAKALGITVRIESLPFGHSWWIPELRTITVDETVVGPYRDTWVAHQLAHAIFNPDTIEDRAAVELKVVDSTTRQSVVLGELARVVAEEHDPVAIAHRLRTVPEMIHARVQLLTPGERTFVGDLVDSIAWDQWSGPKTFECVQYPHAHATPEPVDVLPTLRRW